MKENIIYVLLISVMFFSCEKNFEEFNTDPLQAQVGSEEVEPRFQLGPITERLEGAGQISMQAAPEYSRHFSYNNSSYRISEMSAIGYSQPWQRAYLINPTINNVLAQTAEATDPVDIVVGAITKICKAYIFTALSDVHGDIPYFEAGDIAIQFPVYDSQEAIYNDGFKLIDEAIASLSAQVSAGVQLPDDDRVYGGDVAKWIRFANSLKLRLAMRLRAVDSATSSSRVSEALSQSGGLISNHEESGTLQNFAAPGPSSVLWQIRFEPFRLAKFFVDYLTNTNDPRLPIWAEPAVNGGGFVGVDNSLIDFPDNDNFSRLSDTNIFREDIEDIILMYSEVEFLKAEAHLLGHGTSKDDNAANTAYRAGIRASLEYWGVDSADIDTFLAQDFATLTGDDDAKLQQIGEQKWVSLFLAGGEIWSEVRRLGYPVIPPTTGLPGYFQGDNNGEIPVRLEYPDNGASFNAENFDAANSRYPLNIGSRVWWDVD